jgi:hypothetical protein
MEDFLTLGRFETTARLFAAVAALAVQARWKLLEQMIGDRLPALLCQMVIAMPAEKRQALLERLLEAPFEEAGATTTLTLDDDDTFMRRNPRKACRLKAVGMVGAERFEAVITDISPLGVFLATPAVHPAGAEIRLRTRLPGAPEALLLTGVITRGGPNGMAVRFEGLSGAPREAIGAFVAEPG